jgi:hypothetical protein
MKKLSIALILLVFWGCNSESQKKSDSFVKTSRVKDSVKNKTNGSVQPFTDADLPPSQAEENQQLIKTYDKVVITDSIFIDNIDTLHFLMKYHCLKDVDLVIPKFYDEAKPQKDFLTHPFVADILLINKKDTVLNRQFRASDFYPFFKDNFGGNLKKYASIFDPGLYRQNKDKSHIYIGFSISIPSTDLGIGTSLVIDKNGKYKILGTDEPAKIK